jgi:hypothetical protein
MSKLRPALLALLLSVAAATSFAAKPSGIAYPSGSSVPENLLRIELRFSAPLRSPLDISHVKLFDANGREISNAFLDLPLPADNGRLVTILMDPARVKSGVGANLALRRALHRGSTVTLVVDDPAIAQPIRKTWQVTAFDANPPQPARWTFEPPRLGSQEPITVHLDVPLSLSSESLIAIRAPDGERVAGEGRLERGETVWRFVPAHRWHQGTYALVTHPDLEDPAGNRTCGPFEAVSASRVRCDEGVPRAFQPRNAVGAPRPDRVSAVPGDKP